jgi:hypothetical protein
MPTDVADRLDTYAAHLRQDLGAVLTRGAEHEMRDFVVYARGAAPQLAVGTAGDGSAMLGSTPLTAGDGVAAEGEKLAI